MSIADLELAAEAAQALTDGHLANARTFAAVAKDLGDRLYDWTRTEDREKLAADLKFATDQAVASEQDYHTAALAELTARRELDEARRNPWEPIATAPKDGSQLLGLTNYGPGAVWWEVDAEVWLSNVDPDPNDPCEPLRVTHWMPLPAGPEVRS